MPLRVAIPNSVIKPINDAIDSVPPERKIVAVVRHEALRTVELRRTELLPHVVGVIAVRLIVGQIRQVLAPGVGTLHHEAAGELLAHGRLQAVVIGSSIEVRTSHADSLVTEVRDAERNVGDRIGGDSVDRMLRARQSRGIVVVILAH